MALSIVDQDPALPVAVDVREGETIYDYAWYPYMTCSDVATCCFLASTRDTPIHLWDSITGRVGPCLAVVQAVCGLPWSKISLAVPQKRASYIAYDHLDEPTAAYSLAFNSQVRC